MFRGKIKKIISFPVINFLFGIAGLIIIWIATENWIAIIGGIIAGLHIEITINNN